MGRNIVKKSSTCEGKKAGCDSMSKCSPGSEKSQTEARKDGKIHGEEKHHHAQRARAVKPGGSETDRAR